MLVILVYYKRKKENKFPLRFKKFPNFYFNKLPNFRKYRFCENLIRFQKEKANQEWVPPWKIVKFFI